MYFIKGSELDKQIYKEGEPTWGLKSGVLDVEDVKTFIARIKNDIETIDWEDDADIIKIINDNAGEKLIKNYALPKQGESK